jgi:DNA-binding winged helix-turn-helix (wHTH) protein
VHRDGPPSDLFFIGPRCWLGDVEFLADARELRRDGVSVHVEPKVFDLIRMLAERHHRVVTRQELLDSVWQGETVCPAAVAQCVCQARRVLGDGALNPRFIKTVQRRGYRWIAPVESHSAGALDRRMPRPGGDRVAVAVPPAQAHG